MDEDEGEGDGIDDAADPFDSQRPGGNDGAESEKKITTKYLTKYERGKLANLRSHTL